MNRRAAKTIRLYCNLRKKEGAPVILQDMKRRYLGVPAPRRGDVLLGMEYYLAQAGVHKMNPGDLRALKARAEQIPRRSLGGYIMNLLGRFMGLSGGNSENTLDKPGGVV